MDMKKTTNLEFEVTREVNTMKKFLKIMLIIIGAISLIFVALIGIGLFVDVEYDDHIENGRYTYVPEEENKDNEYVEFTINDYDKNNAKLVYYDTIEEAIQLSTLNAENEELSVPADFLNHVMKPCIYGKAKNMIRFSIGLEMITMIFKA